MSELKGQLLGMLLVIVLFGAVALTLFGVFNKTSENIGTKMDEDITLVTSSH